MILYYRPLQNEPRKLQENGEVYSALFLQISIELNKYWVRHILI